jgi:hypothetical protein
MAERGIIFSAPMVRAILDGRKTQTRRVVKDIAIGPGGCPSFARGRHHGNIVKPKYCPYGRPGDRLWVRETFLVDHYEYIDGPFPNQRPFDVHDDALYFRADGSCCQQFEQCPCGEGQPPRWRPSIHMPRWASRITLEIESVRVERVQDISEEDAQAEGIEGPFDVGYRAFRLPGDSKPRYSRAAAAFEVLWDSIHGPDAWHANPWVWAITFRRIGSIGGA